MYENIDTCRAFAIGFCPCCLEDEWQVDWMLTRRGIEASCARQWRVLHRHKKLIPLKTIRGDLSTELRRPFRTAHAEQITRYGHVIAESTLSRAPSRRHLTFPF